MADETIVQHANLATILLAIGKLQGVQESHGNQAARIEAALVQLRTEDEFKHRDNQEAIAALRQETRIATETLRDELRETLEAHCVEDDRRFDRLNKFMYSVGGALVLIQALGALWVALH